jgi:hypothetical protein
MQAKGMKTAVGYWLLAKKTSKPAADFADSRGFKNQEKM